MKPLHFFFIATLGLISQGSGALEIVYRTVESFGNGTTEKEAVRWAQINALQQVTGSANVVSEWADEGLTTTNQGTSTKESYALKVLKTAAGIIRSYEIKRTSFNESENLWTAVLDVTVLDIDRTTGRKSIFIPTAVAKSKSAKIFASHLTASIKSQFASSRKFSLFERNLNENIESELDSILKNPMIPLSYKVFSNEGYPLELVLTANIETASITLKEWKPSSNLMSVKIPAVSIGVSYQIIDVFSSKIEFQNIANFSLGPKDFENSEQRVNESNISLLTADIIGSRIVNTILDAIYPTILTSISDENTISLNFGSDFNEEGDIFEIYRRGSRIYDPYTEEFISWDEKLIGKVRLTRVLSKLSFGKIEASSDNLKLIKSEISEKSRQFIAYKIIDSQKKANTSADTIKKTFSDRKNLIEQAF